MSLDEIAAVLAATAPTFRRMSPVSHTDGVTFIRDDWKAPADSIPETLAFMRDANADRKLAVLGRISDFPGRSRRTYSRIAREAMASLDAVIFVGERAVDLWGEQRSFSLAAQSGLKRQVLFSTDDAVETLSEVKNHQFGDMFVFSTVRAADAFLQDYLKSGDLVLVKGSGPKDHLERIILNREQQVTCWLAQCGRLIPCDMCELIRAPAPVGGDACWI
jgi:UDP-N-acetylmuramyl pentapeptide synthase